MSTTDSLHGVAEGAYTARLRADEEAAQIRADRADNARGNLAAIVLERHGINARHATLDDLPDTVKTELRELAEALGLDQTPSRRPGYCACGAVLPMTVSGAKALGRYKYGHCLRCSTEDQ